MVAPVDALAEALNWYRDNPVDWQNDPIWPDRFNYALEDRVREELEALGRKFEGQDPGIQPVHNYAHPQQLAVGARDERSR